MSGHRILSLLVQNMLRLISTRPRPCPSGWTFSPPVPSRKAPVAFNQLAEKERRTFQLPLLPEYAGSYIATDRSAMMRELSD